LSTETLIYFQETAFAFKHMYIIRTLYLIVNRKCTFIVKHRIGTSGGGTRNHLASLELPQKRQIFVKFLLTPAQIRAKI